MQMKKYRLYDLRGMKPIADCDEQEVAKVIRKQHPSIKEVGLFEFNKVRNKYIFRSVI